jgi:hypothetical protein
MQIYMDSLGKLKREEKTYRQEEIKVSCFDIT